MTRCQNQKSKSKPCETTSDYHRPLTPPDELHSPPVTASRMPPCDTGTAKIKKHKTPKSKTPSDKTVNWVKRQKITYIYAHQTRQMLFTPTKQQNTNLGLKCKVQSTPRYTATKHKASHTKCPTYPNYEYHWSILHIFTLKAPIDRSHIV